MPDLAAALTVRGALVEAADGLRAAGIDTPRLDAELLLGHVLGVGREQLVLRAQQPLDPATAARFEQLVRRRGAREPVAYIVGHKAFRNIELEVDSRVLIPRPETELLVELGLGLPSGSVVVDVGTGSGAVALALKQERPDLNVLATDISSGALELARQNARRLGLKVRFLEADLLTDLPVSPDAVLANLPYIAEGFSLAPEISGHEPALALFAGHDGLDVIRRLVRMCEGVPLVALEVGFDQAGVVAALLGQSGFKSVERVSDLAGHERVVLGRR